MMFTVDQDIASTSELHELPAGDWSLTLPASLPAGAGIAALHAPGHPRWFAVIESRQSVVCVMGAWRAFEDAITQLLLVVLARLASEAMPPEAVKRLVERMPNPASLTHEQRREVALDWLKEIGGQEAADDPLGYMTALLDHLADAASGKGPTVH